MADQQHEQDTMSHVYMRISDILVAPNLDINSWGVNSLLSRLAQEFDIHADVHVPDLADLGAYRVELKGERNYDGERGAELHVIYHEDQVICICSFAGRGLDDVCSVYIYSHKLLKDLILRFTKTPDSPKDDLFDPNRQVSVVYWEGCPIQLGKSVWGYDDEN